MSLEDLFESELFPWALLMLWGLKQMLKALPDIIKNKEIDKYNYQLYGPEFNYSREPDIEVFATCIEKRMDPHPLAEGKYVQYLLFLLMDGSRICFAIRDLKSYSTIVVGDVGCLRYFDNHFVSFTLTIPGEATHANENTASQNG